MICPRQTWPGANGPLLVSVRLEPPAKPNTKKLKQVQAKQDKQQQQAEEQYQEAASQAAAAGEPAPKAPPPPPQPTAKQQQKQQQQEKFLKSTASDPCSPTA